MRLTLQTSSSSCFHFRRRHRLLTAGPIINMLSLVDLFADSRSLLILYPPLLMSSTPSPLPYLLYTMKQYKFQTVLLYYLISSKQFAFFFGTVSKFKHNEEWIEIMDIKWILFPPNFKYPQSYPYLFFLKSTFLTCLRNHMLHRFNIHQSLPHF